MPLSDLSVCNLAIGRIGGDAIEVMGEESPLGAYCGENYAHKRDYVLGRYRWTFANRVALLAELAAVEGEVRPLAHKYAKPADLVGAVHAWRETADPTRARVRPYVLDADDGFWSDQRPLFAEYTAAKPEATWPAWFTELVVTAFAADLAGFSMQRGLQRDLETKAWGTPSEAGEGGLYLTARNEDARLAPPRELVAGVDPGPLVESRYGGGGGFRGFGFTGFVLPGGG